MSSNGSQNMKSKLECSKNYDAFEFHEFNRPEHEDKVLLESMRTHGFMPSSPIHCVQNGNGKMKVIRGHHRLTIAKLLSIPFYYIVDDSNTDIYSLEGGKQKWSLADFAESRARAGDEGYVKLLWFKEKHKLTWGSACSLVGGQSAGSNNKQRDVKMGKFEVGDLKHANQVVYVLDACREAGIKFCSQSSFVAALSLSIRLSEFDADYFVHHIRLYAANLRKRGAVHEYLEEIEAFYNYGRKKKIPLAFMAKEAAKKRSMSFARNNA